MSTQNDRLERFLCHLDEIFEIEPEFIPLKSKLEDIPGVVCMVYRDIPEPGSITGVTYGLSEATHPKWLKGRAELTISVESPDLAWPLAIAEMANNLRGNCPFVYGDIIDFGGPISPDSEMSAFVIFAPSILEKESFLEIDVGGPQRLNIAGAYPIYELECDVIPKMGLKAFWQHPNFDHYNVRRPPVDGPEG